MIIEQAFQILPEILCGSRYPGQEYEAGLVSAFTMAVLQELNGRNAPNPLGCIRGECLYDGGGFGGTRWLRSDLVVDTSRLRVASSKLGDHYGWRHRNWVECKFMRQRGQGPVGTKTQITALMAADLVRLATLIPEAPGVPSSNGRYMLHVYDRTPPSYLAERRNANTNGPQGTRRWTKVIVQPGQHECVVNDLSLEPATAQAFTGPLGDYTLRATLTTQAILPIAVPADPPKLYWCYLTRLDGVSVALQGRSFSLSTSRAVTEGHAGDFEWIRSTVASLLGTVAPDEEEPPEDPPTDEEPGDQQADPEPPPGPALEGDGAHDPPADEEVAPDAPLN